MWDEQVTDEQPSERQIVDAAHQRGQREGDFVILVTLQQEYEGLAQNEIAKYAKIAHRHGQVFDVVNRKTWNVEKTHKLTGRKIAVPYVRLAIQIPAIVGEKGQIVAHFERAEDGDSWYTHVFDDTRRGEAEAYLPKLGICEHCNTKRRRNDVFVCDTTDGIKIVGSDCLKDYLGIDPIWQMHALKFIAFAAAGTGDYDEDRPSGGRAKKLSTDNLVRECYRVSKKFGGYSRQASGEMRETLYILLHGVFGDGKARDARQAIWEEYNHSYGAGKDWKYNPDFDVNAFVNYMDNMQGDFGSNLRIALAQDYVHEDRVNIVLAGVGVFVGKLATIDREKEARAALPAAKLVDAPVKKRVDLVGTVLRTTPYSNDFGGGVVIAIRCDGGENLVHFYSGKDEVEAGKRYLVRGTVKAHGTDKRSGEPQTVISRAIYKDAPLI